MLSRSRSHYYFSDFSHWQHIVELLLTSNILALVLAVASVPTLHEWSWWILIQYILFVTWIAVSFAVCMNGLQPWSKTLPRHIALRYAFIILLGLVFFSTIVVNTLVMWFDSKEIWQWQGLFQQGFRHLILGAGLGVICLRYFYLREQWIERQQSALVAKVQALQARIHPHFLFNSLNSVVSLISIDPNKAEQVLIDLSSLFRASLAEMKEVSLQEEIALCLRYLKIEKIRLGERLLVNWRIDGESQLKFAKIPLLSLQPLLENCIYHGVESMPEPSTVSILVGVKGKQVSIVLTNPYQIQTMRRRSHGIASDNVKQRLLVYYSPNVQFKMWAKDGIFTTILSYRYK